MTDPHPEDRRLPQVETLLATILGGNQSAARVVENHFRRHRQLGSGDRAWIRERLWQALRHRRLIALARGGDDPRALARGAEWLLTAGEEALAAQAAERLGRPLAPAERHSLPAWLWQRLAEQWGEARAADLAAALNGPAPLDLRANRRRGGREAALAALAAAGLTAAPLPLAPEALRLPPGTSLLESPPYRQGLVEIQDAGSQLIALLLAPRPGEVVVDLCAGGGGKSLHLADLMGERGKVVACDVDRKRLEGLKPRVKRAGVGIIQARPLRHERDPGLRPLTARADGVLVDAPCSGSGTLRRQPELKWRLTPAAVAGYRERQAALLEAGAALVRPGGRLLYATCSLLEEENQAVVAAFLAAQPAFRPLDAPRALAAQGAQLPPTAGPFLALTPLTHGCDGFFAALLQRR